MPKRMPSSTKTRLTSMADFFKLPVEITEAMSQNDMMLIVGGDKVTVTEYTVVNEGNGCNVEGALNKGTGCGC